MDASLTRLVVSAGSAKSMTVRLGNVPHEPNSFKKISQTASIATLKGCIFCNGANGNIGIVDGIGDTNLRTDKWPQLKAIDNHWPRGHVVMFQNRPSDTSFFWGLEPPINTCRMSIRMSIHVLFRLPLPKGSLELGEEKHIVD